MVRQVRAFSFRGLCRLINAQKPPMKIQVESKEFEVSSWNEKRTAPNPPCAGIAPSVQEHMDEEAAKYGTVPRNWDVCFECGSNFRSGTRFSLRDGRVFVVSASQNSKHWASASRTLS
jgi:hypothetical protein